MVGPPKLGDNWRVAPIDVDTVSTTYAKANAILSMLSDFARKECVGWEGSCLRSAGIPSSSGSNQIDQGKRTVARESSPSALLGLRGVKDATAMVGRQA